MQWYEDDELWSGFADFMFGQRRAGEAEEYVTGSPLLDFPPDARVLDLCCGPALYVVPLARRGHRVTGVDLSPAMLHRGEAACAAAGVSAELVQGDMATFVRPGGFDVVLNMYTSFGYFAEPERNRQVLRNAFASLAPGGQLIVDVFGKEVLARRVGRPQVVELPDATVFLRDTILDDWTRLRTEWTMIRGGQARTASLTSFIYSAAELRTMFEDVGFVDVEAFGGFDARPYDPRATRLVVRGRRR
ncbi:class I SAM-dependent methyltransferase [Micromonospora sp. SH-82]|uniref:class I SAM-dependent methyltransferase n=1 Tax=Micromonospora sp. SH-82 TaxID=3132938 RepID=UPI003EB80E18